MKSALGMAGRGRAPTGAKPLAFDLCPLKPVLKVLKYKSSVHLPKGPGPPLWGGRRVTELWEPGTLVAA